MDVAISVLSAILCAMSFQSLRHGREIRSLERRVAELEAAPRQETGKEQA